MPEPKKPAAKEEAPPADKPAEDDDGRDELPEDEHVPGEESQMSEISGLFVERPQTVAAIKGKDVTFVAKVDSSQMLRKPAVKWFKGKWLDLASKAGKHLQFKETYDRNTKIYTYEMTIVKVVDGDAGGYRCEVTSKDKCDTSALDVTVEAAEETQQTNILEAFKRSGDAGEDAGDLDFSALLKKREILKNAKPCDYEKIAFEYGITDLRGMLTRLKKMKKGEPKKSDAFLKKLDPAYSVEKGKKIQLSVELTDPNAQVKWLKNGQEIKPSAKYVFESVGGIRKLTINKCTLADDAAYECVVGEEKSFTEVFIQEPPVTITKMLDDAHVVEGDKVEFEVEVSDEGANVKWMKDGVELSRDGKYRFKKDGTKHWLIINEATTEDIGTYYVYTSGGESKAELEVEERELEVLQSIADLTVKAAEQAVFKCEVSDEKVTGKWFKDGVEVVASDRIKMSHIGRTHKLVISDVKPEDAGDYTFVPDGYALSLSAKLNFLEIKIDYVPRQEPPKIHLDATGSMVNKNTIIVVAGNKLRFDVDITGEPPPTVAWKKGDMEISQAEGRVRVETRKALSCFVIEGAERSDEGLYHITVTNPAGEDKADVFVKIVDVPDPPENVKCLGVGEDSASIEWKPPKDNGNTDIIGYTVQKADKKTKEWFTVLEHNCRPSCTVSDLVMGNEYFFRIFSENICGMSEEAGLSKNTAVIAKTGLQYKPQPYKEKDMNSSPKFITPLVDRSVVAGYSAAISCAVRGCPKPKIIWMKNKMIIGEDPKFLMQNNQGVLTLNIRKPSLFDCGKYTCKAINDLGEDEVECRLEVRVVTEKEEAKK
nr:Zgc:136545 [Danio rerio]